MTNFVNYFLELNFNLFYFYFVFFRLNNKKGIKWTSRYIFESDLHPLKNCEMPF